MRDEDFGKTCLGSWRTKIWNILEYPETSKTAQLAGLTSLFMTCFSIITFIVGTNFEDVELDNDDELEDVELDNDDDNANAFGNPDAAFFIKYVINIFDIVAVLFFSMEYGLQLVLCPRKWKFVSNRMNIIDLLAIAPFYLSGVLAGLEGLEIISKQPVVC